MVLCKVYETHKTKIWSGYHWFHWGHPMSEVLLRDNEQNSEFERWDRVLNSSEENEGDSLDKKVHALFETEYNGERKFGPQGLVDYWTKLKDDIARKQADLQSDSTPDLSQADELRKRFNEDNKKMMIVREYLEKEIWGDELVKKNIFDLTWNKERIEPLINSCTDAEAIYSRVLMGERNIIWADGDLESNKYGSGLKGKSTINDAGFDILVSSDFLPLMEGWGVDIDGNDILARTYDPGIIAENVETLCRYGVNINVLMNKIQDYPYAIARNLGALLSAGAIIDIDGLVASLDVPQKVSYLENLCRYGGKIDIGELIESAWQEAERENKERGVDNVFQDSRHNLIGALMRKSKTIIEHGGRNAVDILRGKLETLGLDDDEAKLLADIPNEKIDEFGLSNEDKERRLKKWEEINVTEADKEMVKNSNFNGVDISLDIDKPASPEDEDRMNYYLKTFCDIGSSGSVWSKSDLSERKIICTEMVNFLRERLGITMEARIVFSELNDNTGGHMGSTKDGRGLETAFNSKHLEKMDSLYAIEAITHETWHFYQIQCALFDPMSDIGKIYKKNLDQYVHMDDGEEEYLSQPLEEEAYRFGRMFREYVEKLEKKLNNKQNTGA